jgi:Protein of unknown function (DUF1549)/Protein of unknown function (DUF1553)
MQMDARFLKSATLLLGAFLAACGGASFILAEEPVLEPIAVGVPLRLEVFPPVIKLSGPRSRAQLVVTGHYADGSVQDLTRASQFATTAAGVVVVEQGIALPQHDGQAEVAVVAGGRAAVVPVEVTEYDRPEPVSFEFDALAALSKQGCNSGACHGSPSGKGGFRLSLRAFDAALDKLTLIREDLGRRTNPLDPDGSLLLNKPLMKLPHGGGLKLTKHDPAYAALRQWIAEGCQVDAESAPRCVRIEVLPASGRLLKWPAHTQQLAVVAHFSDGSTRDVTQLACYSSSDSQVADVTAGGLVAGRDRGETAVIVRYLEHIESCFLTFVKDIPGYVWSNPQPLNYIDQHVDAKLRQLQYLPSGVASDDEFLRRVYLDVIGQLPTLEESKTFLNDASPAKRAKLIDQLLDRPEHAKFWALKWGDLLRMTSTQVGNSGVFKYHRWLERAFETNMPYDQFARELLTASGSTLDNPTANFYRTSSDTQDSVESISQIFLGARLQCAKCHNHPFERWTQDNYFGLAAFFNRVQRKKSPRGDELLIYLTHSGEVTQPRTGKQMKPWLPGKGDIDPSAMTDRRQPFVEWLTAQDNSLFAKVEANRIWTFVLGRGIVDPPDDFRDSNPPSNAALLDALAKDFAEHGFDRRHLLRIILNSRTYQADFRGNEFNKDETKYFSHYQPRMLSAEQLLDAICAMTGLPETFTGMPAGMKATELPAPDLAKHEFLKIFGQPERQTVCACERSSDSNLGMAIQFFNGPLIYGKLRDTNNRFRKLMTAGKPHEEIIRELYLAAVCRTPTSQELAASLAHLAAKQDPVAAMEDIAWAILNTNEFLFQH